MNHAELRLLLIAKSQAERILAAIGREEDMAKRKHSKKPAPITAAPVATIVPLAKEVTTHLVAITSAWSEIRRIAHDELQRLAGK